MEFSRRSTKIFFLFCCFLGSHPFLSFAADKLLLKDLPQHVLAQSQITSAGATPFHLRAKVLEATNPANDSYKAEIEEYWVSPEKWKRTVKTHDFSQTLIVNGNSTSEQLTGNYYPDWLQTFVNAIFEPAVGLQGIDMFGYSDKPFIGKSQVCLRFAYRAGIPPVGNNVFSGFCVEGDLLDLVFKPGYNVEYKSYRRFKQKQVARELLEHVEHGTDLEASIDDLSELHSPDDSLFAIQQSTAQLKTLQISEAQLRGRSINTPAMQWPAIRSGKAVGVLSIYVRIDRDGNVRETHALNSDRPEMSDAARRQLMSWRYKPAASNGVPVQLESILTFSYETKIVR